MHDTLGGRRVGQEMQTGGSGGGDSTFLRLTDCGTRHPDPPSLRASLSTGARRPQTVPSGRLALCHSPAQPFLRTPLASRGGRLFRAPPTETSQHPARLSWFVSISNKERSWPRRACQPATAILGSSTRRPLQDALLSGRGGSSPSPAPRPEQGREPVVADWKGQGENEKQNRGERGAGAGRCSQLGDIARATSIEVSRAAGAVLV